MASLTITAANAVFMLSVDSVFPTAQQLQQFGVDEAFDPEQVDAGVVEMGVDGIGVGGWLPRVVPMTVTLQAASPSFRVFEDWVAAQDQLREVLYGHAIIRIPAIGREYTCAQGTLVRHSTMPSARRTLRQRQWQITWMPPSQGIPAITSAPIA
jgi:hypothetical protein